MRHYPIDNSLFKTNRERFVHCLPKDSTTILFSNDQYPRNGDQIFKFRQNSDLLYLSGIDQEKTILLLSPECPNKKLREALFIIKTNEKLATWEGHKYTKNEAREISGIDNVFLAGRFRSLVERSTLFY